MLGPQMTEINFDLRIKSPAVSGNFVDTTKIHLMIWQDCKRKSYEDIQGGRNR